MGWGRGWWWCGVCRGRKRGCMQCQPHCLYPSLLPSTPTPPLCPQRREVVDLEAPQVDVLNAQRNRISSWLATQVLPWHIPCGLVPLLSSPYLSRVTLSLCLPSLSTPTPMPSLTSPSLRSPRPAPPCPAPPHLLARLPSSMPPPSRRSAVRTRFPQAKSLHIREVWSNPHVSRILPPALSGAMYL